MDHHLIITIDYEIFGNGQGCLNHCLLDPADQMMKIASRFNAPLTFFVEALEFMAMERYEGETRVRQQLGRAVRNAGHDAQLHLHPQWWEAERGKDGGWKLNMSRWRIGDLESSLIADMVASGKSWLKEVVDSPGYECIAFRAGGWCIQPAKNVLPVLRAKGIRIDSTVAPGFWNASPDEWCDFREAPALPYWSVDRDVCKVAKSELLEVPITTGHIGPLRHLRSLFLARSGDALAPGCTGCYKGADGPFGRALGKLSKLARLGHVMLDISTMSADVLIDLTRKWLKRHASHVEKVIPVVAIAHTKNFTPASQAAMAAYFNWAKGEGLTFSTFGRWLEAQHDGN